MLRVKYLADLVKKKKLSEDETKYQNDLIGGQQANLENEERNELREYQIAI